MRKENSTELDKHSFSRQREVCREKQNAPLSALCNEVHSQKNNFLTDSSNNKRPQMKITLTPHEALKALIFPVVSEAKFCLQASCYN